VIKTDGSGNTQNSFSAGLHPFLPDLRLKKRVAYTSWWPTNNALNNASFSDEDDDACVIRQAVLLPIDENGGAGQELRAALARGRG
jgi:hypothetical protein